LPGTLGGVSGSADPQTAGTAFSVTVYATDQYSNIVSTGRNNTFLYTDDPYDINPGSFSLTNGQLIVNNVNPNLAGVTTLYANDHDGSAPTLTTASSTFTVRAAAASKLQLVLPGENTVPGDLSRVRGVSGTPSTQPAGAAFNVAVNIVDAFWNPANTGSGTV